MQKPFSTQPALFVSAAELDRPALHALNDAEAGLHAKRDSRGCMKSARGYPVRAGVDREWFVRRRTAMAGNAHDSRERDRLLPGDETALYADAAYRSREMRETLSRLGISDCVQRKGYRGRPSKASEKDRNAAISFVRSGIERVFAVSRRCYGPGRTRFPGLAKNMAFYGLAAIAHNIRKGACFLRLYGVRALAIGG